jgi:hypothetical protein
MLPFGLFVQKLPARRNCTLSDVIEEGVLEDIEPNTMIWIWGERTGDRINADAVLYLVLPISM